MNRRDFLAAAGGAMAAGCAGPGAAAPGPAAARPATSGSARIDRIELFPLRYPMTGYFKFFTGPHGGAGRAAVLVKVTDSDGVVGWGQSVPIAKWSDETLETATVALRDYFVPALLGLDVDDLAGAHRAMDAAIAPGFSTGMPITRAGVDIALHDLIGKRRGVSVAALWGRRAEGALTLSWTVNVQKLDDVAALVQQGRARAYRHFNIKVGPDPEFDVALAKAVRELAPECFLWADANGGYTVDAALIAAPKLADAGVDVLESPLRPNLIAGYQRLKKLGALPVLMDEGVVSATDLREFHQLGMLDGVAMKPSRCGGLESCRRQIEFCIDHGLMWLGSGLTDPDISLAATLQVFSAYGLTKPAALNGPQFLTADLLKVPLAVVAGTLAAPPGPGLGIEVDEARVRAMVSERRDR